MYDIKFSTKHGNIVLNGEIIAPFSLTDFKVVASDEGIDFIAFNPTVEWTTIGIDVSIQGQPFSMNISYHENNLQSCWFDWGGGVSRIKGYDTSQSEIIADKNNLTKLIGKVLSRQPDKKNYTNDIFSYEWGYISSSVSIQSVIVSIGVVWTTCPADAH